MDGVSEILLLTVFKKHLDMFGIGLNVVLAFCMGTDTQSILSSPIGQPMATVSDKILATLSPLF